MDPDISIPQTQASLTPQQSESLINAVAPQDVYHPPFLYKFIYWFLLVTGIFFLVSIAPLLLTPTPGVPVSILIFENLMFGVPQIIAYIGLRKLYNWGIAIYGISVLDNFFTIVTDLDGNSRGIGSFVTLFLEILVFIYIRQIINNRPERKWF